MGITLELVHAPTSKPDVTAIRLEEADQQLR
jgi:hypothetical protein